MKNINRLTHRCNKDQALKDWEIISKNAFKHGYDITEFEPPLTAGLKQIDSCISFLRAKYQKYYAWFDGNNWILENFKENKIIIDQSLAIKINQMVYTVKQIEGIIKSITGKDL